MIRQNPFPKMLSVCALLLPLASCDKARNLAGSAREAVREKLTGTKGEDPDVDSEWEKLVDRTADGVVFRKDQPFPANLKVKTVRKQEIDARLHQTSEIERKNEAVKGTKTDVFELERSLGIVRYTSLSSGFSKPVIHGKEEGEKAQDPLELAAPRREPLVFRKSGTGWRAESKDVFYAATATKEIGPRFDWLLEENALSARPHWFSKRRFKPGDTLSLSGASLAMLVAGNAKGSLELKLEGFEAVDGQPCGVFDVKGGFSRERFPEFNGVASDEEVTIDSGKVWLSLLHPVILREELETVRSVRSGGIGGVALRWQGKVRVSVVRTWQEL